jgi:hypothetical protein
MASTETFPSAGAAGAVSIAADPLLDAERLDVYQVALAFQRLVPQMVPPRDRRPLA